MLMVLESNPSCPPYHRLPSPIFVFYRDGLVLWVDLSRYDHEAVEQHYQSVRLSEAESRRLADAIASPETWKLGENYEVIRGEDFPQLGLWIWGGDRKRTIWIYGLGVKAIGMSRLKPGTLVDDWQLDKRRILNRARALLPRAIVRIVDLVAEFQHEKASPWVPSTLELMVISSPESPSTVPWPSELPQKHDLSLMPVPAGAYTKEVSGVCQIDSRYLPVLRNATRGHRLLMLDDRHQVTYRLRFPAEDCWSPPPTAKDAGKAFMRKGND